MPTSVRRTWTRLWVVDPLDGTREFVKRNGEFTVNIALVEDGEVLFGVIQAPVTSALWHGARGQGAFRREGDADLALHTRVAAPAPLLVPVHPETGREQTMGRGCLDECSSSMIVYSKN